ncbi:MAG: tryptophan synthase subunit beta [Spirochaetia bacterium]|jgi:tryptophan synthase beta chain|nr:tryptophan synthase subunit beta [Spirochaetia bacterium]
MTNYITKDLDMTGLPGKDGFFGEYGGAFIPPELAKIMKNVADQYQRAVSDPSFCEEYEDLLTHFVGRPSPVYFAKRLSQAIGGADIYLKREDLNHTGAHKINHCVGEALLAKRMGYKKIIAETGAGQHGVALATAAALLGLDCDIYMGAVDVAKEAPNVTRMKILGAKVVSVTQGTQTLKDAVDACFTAYLKDPINQLYCIGSVVGPHPFPMMVRDFQSVVGREARAQMIEMTGRLPDDVIACVGGGSNAAGIFSGFLADKDVRLHGVEPAGKGLDTPYHAATLAKGTKGMIHGFKCYVLQDKEGNPLPVYSIASGLDYPGVGPQHCYLKDIGRVQYHTATDRECIEAFYGLSRMEGIIPALESSHAVAYAVKLAEELGKGKNILVNLSGRGDKDIDFVIEHYPLKDYEPSAIDENGYRAFLEQIQEKAQ